jgi:hypothetical protein
MVVCGFQRVGDLLRDRQGLVEGKGTAGEALREILSVDEFHHERGDAATLFEPVDAGNVRMVQGGEHFRLALKTGEPIGVTRERRRQDLDRDLAFQPGIGGPIYLPHPAFADLLGDFVDAEARARSEGHGKCLGL